MKLPKNVSTENSVTVGNRQTNDLKWDTAITDTEREIMEITKKRSRLAYALRVFRANKRDGIPWPGSKKVANLS